ncbi:hypothetical protein C0J52_05117 [Blattella germanica]|nr:hypothetical protein C0J52_05117 [Blattella germanica]
MRKKSIKKCRRKFRRKFLGIPVPHKSTVQQLVKKVCETGSFSDKKINRRTTVLTEEKLDNIAYLWKIHLINLFQNWPNRPVYLCLQCTKLQNFLNSNRLHFQHL